MYIYIFWFFKLGVWNIVIVLRKIKVVEEEMEFPRYYIGPDISISVNNYGQYVIHETMYIEIDGTITLGEGAMLIIK